MEGINKIISLFLGLVVVMILFAIITGRFNPFKGKTTTNNTKVVASVTPTPTKTKSSNNKFLGIFDLGNKKTATPTPTPTTKKVVVDTTVNGNTQNNTYNNAVPTKPVMKGVSTIPSTGSPTALLPLLGSALVAGSYLRRKK